VTNPISRYRVTVKYKTKANHKNWSVDFCDKLTLAEFVADAIELTEGYVKVKKL
jgi:hypothetical protein